MLESRYFSESEFRLCSPSCSLSDMDEDFMSALVRARELAGVPFILNSAFRSSSWDKSKGRSGSGYHTKGRAVDVVCIDSSIRYKIVRACLLAGLSCGIAKSFIHIDNRENPIIFLY